MYGTVFSAYVTNLGKYTEGQLVGQWLGFPTTRQEVEAVLGEIGIDGRRYEEIFITDYESGIEGLTACLGEYESLAALNCLAHRIQESGYSTGELEALIDSGEHTGSVGEFIALLDSPDCFLLYSGIENDYDLGYYLIHEMGLYGELQDRMGLLANYIDYESYGRDVRLEEGGIYTGNGYYICMIGTPVEYGSMAEIQAGYSVME